MDARDTTMDQLAFNATKDALAEIKAEIREMRAELRAEIRELRGDTKAENRELRQDMKDLRQDMKELRQDQKSDFRLTFGALISVALGLAALMAHGFKWF